MKSNPRKTGITAALTAAVLLLALPALAREVDRTVAADKDGLILVENIAGSIRIEGWDKAEVKVTGTLGDDVEDLEVESGGRKTLVKVVYPKKSRNISDGADLLIMVPRQSSLEVECISAPIAIEGVDGAVEATDISGAITIKGGRGRIEAETISGDLTVEAGDGAVSVQSISGRIEVGGNEAAVEAQSVSGDIVLAFKKFRELSVESVSGDAKVSGALAKGGRIDFDLHGGDVVLTVPGDVSADFRVETFSGDITNAFGATAEKASKYAPGKSLEFTTGGGEARVRVNTFSGNVDIRKK
ncbi:MAG: DUF4097 family beta strand repeat protein [Krumholzibacteria bacterium]|nr:DUF4097 family beta strand repeat protein [Candidatus Krumholzibacteria bacterium]